VSGQVHAQKRIGKNSKSQRSRTRKGRNRIVRAREVEQEKAEIEERNSRKRARLDGSRTSLRRKDTTGTF